MKKNRDTSKGVWLDGMKECTVSKWNADLKWINFYEKKSNTTASWQISGLGKVIGDK